MTHDYAHPETVVSAQWVAQHRADPNVRIIEVDPDATGRCLRRIAFALGLLLLLVFPAFSPAARGAEKYLYVWAGDAARQQPDFVAVVNFDAGSSDYGKVIRAVPLPLPGNIGNEPHHCGLSEDGTLLACGGLLSVLRGQNGIFFFDVSRADEPKFLSSTRAPNSSIADDFYPLPGGGFLLTSMGSATGGTPGRVVEIGESRQVLHEWPDSPPPDGFNPHGISVRPELNLMVTSDFVEASSTLDRGKAPVLRGAVRVWDLGKREIVRTIPLPNPVGTMDVVLIPGDPSARAFTGGMFDGKLYLVDTQRSTVHPVFDFGPLAPAASVPGGLPQVMEISSDGKRMFVPLYLTGKVLMLDTSNPEAPTLLDSVDLGPNAGPHFAELTRDGKRLVVTDYFLNEDDFGTLHFDGDRKVHVLNIEGDRLISDPRFQLDCNTAFASGPARPHGVAMK